MHCIRRGLGGKSSTSVRKISLATTRPSTVARQAERSSTIARQLENAFHCLLCCHWCAAFSAVTLPRR